MKLRYWLTGALGATALAATLAVAPLSYAQSTPPPSANVLAAGQGPGSRSRANAGTPGCAGTGDPARSGQAGSGSNFTDADHDGTCDHAASGQGRQEAPRPNHP